MFENKVGRGGSGLWIIFAIFIYFFILEDPLHLLIKPPTAQGSPNEGMIYYSPDNGQHCMIEVMVDSEDIDVVFTIDEYGHRRDSAGVSKGFIFKTRQARYDKIEIYSKEKGYLTYFFEEDCGLEESQLYHIDSSRQPILFIPNPITDYPMHFQKTTITVGDIDNTLEITKFDI